MTNQIRDARIGMYECEIDENERICKGRYLRGQYIGVFNWDDFLQSIVPDLFENNRLRGAKFPILIVSWQLRGSTAIFRGPLALSRRSMNPRRRKKIDATDNWEAVLFAQDCIRRVKGRKLVSK